MNVKQVPTPPAVREHWIANGCSPDLVPRVYRATGDLSVLLGYEPIEPDDRRWHISISHPTRLPSWRDLVEIAHQLRLGVTFVVGVPPRSWWMNIHPNCLHLWQTKDAALEAQWLSERQDTAPS